MSLETVLDKAESAVVRGGIRILVIDPWNEVEHKRARGESTEEYQERSLRTLRRWARRFEVAVFVVCHPMKMIDGAKPTLYHVSGSAHWFNKPDNGLVIYRRDRDDPTVDVDVKKVRFGAFGLGTGCAMLTFDDQSARFVEHQAEPDDEIGELGSGTLKSWGPPLTEQEILDAEVAIT